MTIQRIKWVAEIPMLPGESIFTLHAQASEFFGVLVTVDLQPDQRIAYCEFRSQADGEVFEAWRDAQTGGRA